MLLARLYRADEEEIARRQVRPSAQLSPSRWRVGGIRVSVVCETHCTTCESSASQQCRSRHLSSSIPHPCFAVGGVPGDHGGKEEGGRMKDDRRRARRMCRSRRRSSFIPHPCPRGRPAGRITRGTEEGGRMKDDRRGPPRTCRSRHRSSFILAPVRGVRGESPGAPRKAEA